MKSVTIFCGAYKGQDPLYSRTAAALATACARRGLRVVYGGGHVGLMGVVADAALAAGGEVIGVIPRDLQVRELAHPGATQMHVVDGMHERKALMGALSDAFIALPGGLGTLEEFFEVLTWSQLRFHHKPCGLLNVNGYFDALLAFIDHAIEQGFIAQKHRALIRVAEDPEAILDAIAAA